jgi:predicted phage-related endonuclease
MNVCFDTLRFTKSLIKGGFTQEQAETSAQAWADALTGNVATQQDIMAVKAELKQDIAELRVATQQDIMAVKQDIMAVKTELKQDIIELNAKIDSIKSELKYELKIEMYKIIGTAVVFLTTVISIFCGIIIHFIK